LLAVGEAAVAADREGKYIVAAVAANGMKVAIVIVLVCACTLHFG
jgi:hypothetical protein